MSSMRRLFDPEVGITGKANEGPLAVEPLQRLGQAIGLLMGGGRYRHLALIGKDTRLSGYMIESSLTAGLLSAGVDITLVGPLPTPAITLLTRSLRADIGIMISGQHRPYEESGLKIFGRGGFEITDDVVSQIEALMTANSVDRLAGSSALGRAARLEDAPGRYIEATKSSFARGGLRFDGLKVVIDCAHGAAYRVAPTVLWELGATVIPIGVSPNGFNINSGCGCTVPEYLCSQVIEHGADVGIAFDGDGARLLMVDERGELIDGDQVLALIAQSWAEAGQLTGGGIVTTVMSNLGLERFLTSQGLECHRTRVGAGYVAGHMRRSSINVGGEQTGHIVLSDFCPSADGLQAALQVLAVLVEQERRASEACHLFEPFPQVLRNVRFSGPSPLQKRSVTDMIASLEKTLAERGRVVIRESGSEPLIRIMVEADHEAVAGRIVDDLCELISNNCDT